MIVLRCIVAICLFTGTLLLIWYLRKNRIVEGKMAAAQKTLQATAAMRQIQIHSSRRKREQREIGKLERIFERPEKLYVYSRIGKMAGGLSFEGWVVFLGLTSAGIYFAALLITGRTAHGLLATTCYYGAAKMIEVLLARKNHKVIDRSLLPFLNHLGNFSVIQGEITNVLRQTAQYAPPILAEALEECYIEAQMTGNVSVALMGLAEQFEHEKFKEIVINLEVCSRYTSNLKLIVDSLRRNLMDAKRASQERRAIADSAIVEMAILSVMLLAVLAVADAMIKASIWDILLHSVVGYIALGAAGICYIIFGLTVMRER